MFGLKGIIFIFMLIFNVKMVGLRYIINVDISLLLQNIFVMNQSMLCMDVFRV